ncbi:MAG: four helix bundle protein [Dissulfurispiraceae bacterium]
MPQLIKSPKIFAIWRKGLELADTIQKIVDNLTSTESLYIKSMLKAMAFTIPSNIAEGFLTHNAEDTKAYFYRTLDCLEKLLTNIRITEQMGYLKKAHIRKIKREVSKLNRLICELISPQSLLLN